MVKSVTFNKTGYDPFIDFLKAYSIVFVVVSHNLPVGWWKYCLFSLWGDMQVPMFILIQVFHSFKKGSKPIVKINSLLRRIVFPFFVIQAIILLYGILFGESSLHKLLINSILMGGGGPGSYYFWVYLQMAFILVIIWPLVQKLSRIQITVLFLVVSIAFEFLFSLCHIPDFVYRLLAIRYLFLIPLALSWINEGVYLNLKSILFSLISIGAVLFFSFNNLNLEPLFYQTGWSTHRWICYFYVPVLLTYVLWIVFSKIKSYGILSSIVKTLAKSSYEIYCVQMLVFVVFEKYTLGFIELPLLRTIVWMCITFSLSILGGVYMHKVIELITSPHKRIPQG